MLAAANLSLAQPLQLLRSVDKVQLSHGPGVLTPTPAPPHP